MPYVKIPRDLSAVRTKVALNLTMRQLICFGTAAAIGVPVYILTRGAIGNNGAALLMIGLMLPLFFIAMYQKDGQPAEKVMRNFIRARFIWPEKRVYKTENLYEIIGKEECIIETKSNAETKNPGGRRRKGNKR